MKGKLEKRLNCSKTAAFAFITFNTSNCLQKLF